MQGVSSLIVYTALSLSTSTLPNFRLVEEIEVLLSGVHVRKGSFTKRGNHIYSNSCYDRSYHVGSY